MNFESGDVLSAKSSLSSLESRLDLASTLRVETSSTILGVASLPNLESGYDLALKVHEATPCMYYDVVERKGGRLGGAGAVTGLPDNSTKKHPNFCVFIYYQRLECICA